MTGDKNSIKTVKCPTCGAATEWTDNNPWRPFCRERCRLIDLGAWADESHRIDGSTPVDFTDEENNT